MRPGRSTLRGDDWRPGVALPASLGLHFVVGLTLFIAERFAPGSGPMFDPSEVMEVSLMAVAKSDRMPDKASRVEPQVHGSTDAVPTERTDSDLVLHRDDAPEDVGAPDIDPAERKRVMDELRRKAALQNLDAAAGSSSRLETARDGVEGATGTSLNALGDPLLARWHAEMKPVVLKHFKPLQKDPGLATTLAVKVDREGNVLDFKITDPSGNPSFDNAASRALRLTTKLPAPPADRMPNDEDWFPLRLRTEDAS
ncbi:MAG: TonB C-terminal domain-containing protein [Proteobacteria bacterium]|nr:TonB C-terminal domain-containing protein [Pseudomonadota bacterium]MCP4915338.1 TonB C-terminal domain-containing protein [Pseudomonadota bacterium]